MMMAEKKHGSAGPLTRRVLAHLKNRLEQLITSYLLLLFPTTQDKKRTFTTSAGFMNFHFSANFLLVRRLAPPF